MEDVVEVENVVEVEKKKEEEEVEKEEVENSASEVKRLFELADLDRDGFWNQDEANIVQKAMKEDAFTKETWEEALEQLNETKGLSLTVLSSLFEGQTELLSKAIALLEQSKDEETEEVSAPKAKYTEDQRVLVRFKGRNKFL